MRQKAGHPPTVDGGVAYRIDVLIMADVLCGRSRAGATDHGRRRRRRHVFVVADRGADFPAYRAAYEHVTASEQDRQRRRRAYGVLNTGTAGHLPAATVLSDHGGRSAISVCGQLQAAETTQRRRCRTVSTPGTLVLKPKIRKQDMKRRLADLDK